MLGMFKLRVFLQILQNLLLNGGTVQKMGFLYEIFYEIINLIP